MHKHLYEMSIEELSQLKMDDCICGHKHEANLGAFVMRPGALNDLPKYVKQLGGSKVFVLCDVNTRKAAGDKVLQILEHNRLASRCYQYPQAHLEPNNEAVGQAAMAFDYACDLIVSVGSGSLNDIGKILARLTARPYIIVATAPSMDGYASATSSMNFDGVKVSLPSRLPDLILADTDVLCAAPLRMFQAGFGDMLAKYISLADWKISHLITEEYYCPEIARLVRRSLKACMETAPGIVTRNPETAEALMEGLTLSGLAMSLAGVSRPASGTEHYFSHIWDMRAASLGLSADSHGLQCLVGTLESLRAFGFLYTHKLDTQKALEKAASFSLEDWAESLRSLLGSAAEPLIKLEAKENKYDLQAHMERLGRIEEVWDDIQGILEDTLKQTAKVSELLSEIEAPKSAADLTIDEPKLRETFVATKDIRDKYIITRLLWDIGELEDAADMLYRA